jgi:hypothetical protein
MRKAFLLAATAFVLAGSFAFAGGKPTAGKKQGCTQCPKSCTGATCAQCCQHGQCVKGK